MELFGEDGRGGGGGRGDREMGLRVKGTTWNLRRWVCGKALKAPTTKGERQVATLIVNHLQPHSILSIPLSLTQLYDHYLVTFACVEDHQIPIPFIYNRPSGIVNPTAPTTLEVLLLQPLLRALSISM